jgi:hypothetical protein
MGYNARNNEIHDNITRMRRAWEAERDALASVRRFNARLSAKSYVWFWPKGDGSDPNPTFILRQGRETPNIQFSLGAIWGIPG